MIWYWINLYPRFPEKRFPRTVRSPLAFRSEESSRRARVLEGVASKGSSRWLL